MYEKKLNLIPIEQKTYLLQIKAKVGAIVLGVVVILGAGGFEYYVHSLQTKVTALQSVQSEVTSVKGQIDLMNNNITDQANLIQTLENKDFPMDDFLLTLSTQLPKDLWLYSVNSADYKPVDSANPSPNGTTATNSPTSNTQANGTTSQASGSNATTNGTTTQPSGNGTTTTTKTPQQTIQPNASSTGANGQTQANKGATGNTASGTGTSANKPDPTAHKTLTIRGAGTSPTEIGEFVQLLNAKNYVKKATLSSVEEYLADNQVYQAFEITVEGK